MHSAIRLVNKILLCVRAALLGRGLQHFDQIATAQRKRFRRIGAVVLVHHEDVIHLFDRYLGG